MRMIILILGLCVFFARGDDNIDIIFGIIQGTVKVLQKQDITDPTGCYVQWYGLHKATNSLVNSIKTKAEIVVLISNVIDMIKNLVCINQYCIIHDIDDDIEHFTKHPGDLIGRLIWNFKLAISFVKNIINGFKTKDYDIIGEGLGAIIYVIFDGKILQGSTSSVP